MKKEIEEFGDNFCYLMCYIYNRTNIMEMKMKKILIGFLSLFIFAPIFAESKNLIFKEVYSNIDTLKVSLNSENISIKEIYGNELTIEVFCNNKRLMPEIGNSNNKLVIDSTRKPIRFGEYCNVEICVPEDYKFKQVTIVQSSGSADIETLNAENIVLEASSGSLNAESLSADYKLKINHSSGSTKIETTASDELDISSSSGSIKIEKINTIDSNITSTSGSIKIEKMDTESFDVKSTSGSVKIENISCDYFTTTTTSGSVTMEFNNITTATSRIRSTSGSVNLYFLEKEGFDILFSTNSGSYTDSIKGERNSPHGSLSSSFFGGGPEIIISTTSGNLSIEK